MNPIHRLRRITIAVLLLGFIPAMKTSLSYHYLSLFDLGCILFCFLLATHIQETLDKKEKEK